MKIKYYVTGIFTLLAFVLLAVAIPAYAEVENEDNGVVNGNTEEENSDENGIENEEEDENGEEVQIMPYSDNDNGESTLEEDQINAVVALLKSFNVETEAIERVKGALRGKAVGPPHAPRTETSEEGLSPFLPTQASERAHQVQTCLQLSGMLRQGVSGEYVKQLQEFLRDEGYFNFPEITGFYGPITTKAIEDFQVAEGIVAEGTPETTGFGQVGPRTRAVIAKLTCFATDPAEESVSTDSDVNEDGDENGDGAENGDDEGEGDEDGDGDNGGDEDPDNGQD